MNRKTITAGITLVLLITAGAILYRLPAVQDVLLKRVSSVVLASTPEPVDGLKVVVCGSASPLGNSMERAQACIAVVTPEHFFLIDVGARSPVRIGQAQLPMGRITGVLLTHYHSDHIAALPDVNLQSWVAGRQASLRVFGPKGIDRVVGGFNEAYALDQGYRVAHHGTELLPPTAGPMTPVTVEPGILWQDAGLTVSSFIVEHDPVSPAVGYRLDYKGRSVVISGDSNATESLFAAAQDADLLFHDALARHSLDIMIEAATEAGRNNLTKIFNDVIDYHADTRTLEDAAEEAGIQQLVLYHLVPTPVNGLMELIFRRGLKDETLLAYDLQTFELPPDSSVISIR
jgi:ribonuclease Z